MVLALALAAAGCSSSSTPATPSATTTPTTTPGTTTSTPASCSFTVSPTTLTVAPAGGTSTITVTGGTGCTWTAGTTSSFVTVSSGTTGSGNGSVVLNVAQDGTANRTGTATIAGQTVTINQTGAGIIVAFDMYDTPSQAGPTSTCRVKGAPGYPITACPLSNTSRTTGSNSLVNYSWVISYTYDGQAKTQTQNTGSIRDFQFYEYCGLKGSSADGTVIPMSITLTVTDNNGITATAQSGAGNQPATTFVAYTCS